ncbi:MAG: hypothetical protein ACI9W6_000542 [Motiliproteus sp.]|jgi:hypothetical protein
MMMPTMTDFPRPIQGSYSSEDCLFLLKPIEANYRTIEDKEKLIQEGRLHYSELIHKELPPTEQYTRLFLEMTEFYQFRLAKEIMALAKLIAEQRKGEICLVSLARAGTPIGVLVRRALSVHLERPCHHFSISIIRDRGIDETALDYLLQVQRVDPESIVFIDGWTAKGTITRELKQSIALYNARRQTTIPDELFVVSDIGGSADFSATYSDYTIPSSLMNSTVSGLISRSILNSEIGPRDFHGCVSYEHLFEYDYSDWFIEKIARHLHRNNCAPINPISRLDRQAITRTFIEYIQAEYGIGDINRIKPGIAESTRVMLRRVPDLLLVKDSRSADVAHLIQLCTEKNIALLEHPDMPFEACAMIKDVIKDSGA